MRGTKAPNVVERRNRKQNHGTTIPGLHREQKPRARSRAAKHRAARFGLQKRLAVMNQGTTHTTNTSTIAQPQPRLPALAIASGCPPSTHILAHRINTPHTGYIFNKPMPRGSTRGLLCAWPTSTNKRPHRYRGCSSI